MNRGVFSNGDRYKLAWLNCITSSKLTGRVAQYQPFPD